MLSYLFLPTLPSFQCSHGYFCLCCTQLWSQFFSCLCTVFLFFFLHRVSFIYTNIFLPIDMHLFIMISNVHTSKIFALKGWLLQVLCTLKPWYFIIQRFRDGKNVFGATLVWVSPQSVQEQLTKGTNLLSFLKCCFGCAYPGEGSVGAGGAVSCRAHLVLHYRSPRASLGSCPSVELTTQCLTDYQTLFPSSPPEVSGWWKTQFALNAMASPYCIPFPCGSPTNLSPATPQVSNSHTFYPSAWTRIP